MAKVTAVRRLIGQAVALQLLPPYSPDLNPIEMGFSKVNGGAADSVADR